MVKAQAKKGKKDKKKGGRGFDALADEDPTQDGAEDIPAPKEATPATVDDLADDEWGSSKDKKKKKGKKGKGKKDEDDEDLEETTKPSAEADQAPVELTVEEAMEDEWGPAEGKGKGKKGKKGKGAKAVDAEAEAEKEEAPGEYPTQ